MATNYIGSGDHVTVAAPSGGVTSGDVVIISSLIGVAATTEVAGADVVLATCGVYELTKTSAQAWAVGAPIYLTSGGVATTASSGNTLIGVATAVAANPSDTGYVRLNG